MMTVASVWMVPALEISSFDLCERTILGLGTRRTNRGCVMVECEDLQHPVQQQTGHLFLVR